MGGAPQFIRTDIRAGAAGRIRRGAAVEAGCGLDRAAVRGAGQPDARAHGTDRKHRPVARARRCNGVSVGTVRGADSRIDPHGRGDYRAEHADDAAVVRLRIGCNHLARARGVCRGAPLSVLQAVTRRSGLDSPRARHCGARGRGGHRDGLGYGAAHAAFVCEHEQRGAIADRYVPARWRRAGFRDGRRARCELERHERCQLWGDARRRSHDRRGDERRHVGQVRDGRSAGGRRTAAA